MNEPLNPAAQPARDPPNDWLDAILARDADLHGDDYVPDSGFTARVMQMLPLAGLLPTWRRPVITVLWAIAAVGLALALPGTAIEVAREVIKLLAARPFALSTMGLMVGAAGLATWTAAAVALRHD